MTLNEFMAADHPKYRSDIDGLRAIAVLSVLGFHAFPKAVKGGFIGVDVFFVISGFLISSIIFKEVAEQRFSFLVFYERRVKRIFPALLTVLAAVLLAGLWIDFHDEFVQLGKHVAAGAGFVSNVLLWGESNYFDIDSDYKPLLHLWSLGVEEQYYIVWPILVAALSKRRLLWLILALLVASFATNIATVGTHPTAAFYLPPARFWELMLGSLLAFMQLPREPGTQRRGWLPSATQLSITGAALLVWALLQIDRNTVFPGYAALLPTVGAALLLAAGPTGIVNRTVLSARPLVWVGLISYPLYLWHWPVLSLMRIRDGDELLRSERIVAVGASFVLATLTYHFIEKPFRFGKQHVARKLIGLCGGMFTIGIVGLLLPWVSPINAEKEAFVSSFENASPRYSYLRRHDGFVTSRDECNFFNVFTNQKKDAIDPACTSSSAATKVLLWGDSHAQQLNAGLRSVFPANFGFLQVATSSCPPRLVDVGPDADSACNRSNRMALQTVRSQKPALVILAQRMNHESTDWHAFAETLKSAGATRVILVGPVPQWAQPLYLVLARHYWGRFPDRLTDHLLPWPLATDAVLKERYAHDSELVYLSPADVLCDSGGCLTRVGPDATEDIETSDYGHFTGPTSRYVVKRLLDPVRLKALGIGKAAGP